MKLKFLELFSGIGGMHLALKEAVADFEVSLAVDINEIANQVYRHNFPETKLLQKNVQFLTKKFVDEISPDGILMSPPCQPFTRLGNKKDLEDKRCQALSHLIKLIPELDRSLKFILLENVKGFEVSEARNEFVECLRCSEFEFREFLLTPLDFSIPNCRLRYYLLAKRKPLTFNFDQIILDHLPDRVKEEPKSINEFLKIEDEHENYQDFTLSVEELKKRLWVLDVVNKNSKKSCCFTKSYGRYAEGTGSVYSPLSTEQIESLIPKLKDCEDFDEKVKVLKLRYLTPEEVKCLMCFPDNFSFPDTVTRRQIYKLFGNSINVKVVSELIKILIN